MNPRHHSWCQNYGADDHQASSTTAAVVVKYQEAHRHYHNLEHVLSSLDWLDQLAFHDPLIEGAIWFHDVIYDPTRRDNEVASARYFEASTSPWLDRETRKEITQLILATDPSNPPTDDPLQRLMVDIDLAILGADPDTYDSYRNAIRREYQHVSEPDFKRGRAAILEQFLAQRIYQTTEFQHLEEPARQNLTRELAQLR